MRISHLVNIFLMRTRIMAARQLNTTKCSCQVTCQREMCTKGHNDQESVKRERIEKSLKEWEDNVNLEPLSPVAKTIHRTHLEAVKNSEETYKDPVTGFLVFTISSHLERGNCCGSACRHCPYEHVNVPGKYKKLKKFNSAFFA